MARVSKWSVPMWVMSICFVYVFVLPYLMPGKFSALAIPLSSSKLFGNLAFLSGLWNTDNYGSKNLAVEPYLLQLNVPLKDQLNSVSRSQKEMEDLIRDKTFVSLNSSNDIKLTEPDTRLLVLQHILNDSAFEDKENVAKLILTIDFIKHASKSGSLNLDQLKEMLSPQNFDGQRFIFANGKSQAVKLEELKTLESSVNLTEKEVHFLETLKPKVLRHRGAGPKQEWQPDVAKSDPAWKRMDAHISPVSLFKTDDPAVEETLHDLSTLPIVKAVPASGGTQVKFILTFSNGGKALFKPMRLPRSQDTIPNHFYFSDYERHTSEIAASLVDRVLGLNRAPPVVGRVVNITRDIKRFANNKLLHTFFVSPSNNICFYGECSYYCDAAHAVCGTPDMLEGSVAYFITGNMKRSKSRHPWRRSYSRMKHADWESNPDYCQKVKNMNQHNSGRRLLDIMDLSVYDFLIQNLDRHHYEYFTKYGEHSTFVHYDNGRSFGRAFYDQLDILAPLYQCCLVRHSMLKKLLNFHNGPVKLSDAVRKLGAGDSIAPVLLEPNLVALDRRVKIILKIIYKCIAKNGGGAVGTQKVVLDDGF